MPRRDRCRRIARRSVTIASLAVATIAPGCSPQDQASTDPIAYLRQAVREYPIVLLAEGGHQARQPHELLRRALADKTILNTIDVVIVEFAAARQQGVLDAYIGGADVPFDTLSRIWRDTWQSPIGPWDSPLYRELLDVIRSANRSLAPAKRVRVLAGDPPIDWDAIQTRDDFERSRMPRDPYVATLATEQAFRLGKKVLVIFGGAHLPKVQVGPDGDLRNSITSYILKQHPHGATAIEFLDPENLRIADRLDELVPQRVYRTDRHWVGGINAELLFPGVYSRVTDTATSEQTWQEVPLYTGYVVKDLFDALIYIGPASAWDVVPAAFDEARDAAYLVELNRRSLLRFGRPFDSGER